MRDVLKQFNNLIIQTDFRELILPDEYVIRARIRLRNNSQLIAQEYIFADTGRTKYSYHWMTESDQLLIRWDDSHHYIFTPTSPHHKHVGSEGNVQPSEPMTLEKVLAFIARQLATSD